MKRMSSQQLRRLLIQNGPKLIKRRTSAPEAVEEEKPEDSKKEPPGDMREWLEEYGL